MSRLVGADMKDNGDSEASQDEHHIKPAGDQVSVLV